MIGSGETRCHFQLTTDTAFMPLFDVQGLEYPVWAYRKSRCDCFEYTTDHFDVRNSNFHIFLETHSHWMACKWSHDGVQLTDALLSLTDKAIIEPANRFQFVEDRSFQRQLRVLLLGFQTADELLLAHIHLSEFKI